MLNVLAKRWGNSRNAGTPTALVFWPCAEGELRSTTTRGLCARRAMPCRVIDAIRCWNGQNTRIRSAGFLVALWAPTGADDRLAVGAVSRLTASEQVAPEQLMRSPGGAQNATQLRLKHKTANRRWSKGGYRVFEAVFAADAVTGNALCV